MRRETTQCLCATCVCCLHRFFFEMLVLVPWPLVLSWDTAEKSLALSPVHPPLKNLYTLMRFPWSFLFSRQNSPTSLSLSEMLHSFYHRHSLSPDSNTCPEMDSPGVASPMLSSGEGSPPSTCWQCSS